MKDISQVKVSANSFTLLACRSTYVVFSVMIVPLCVFFIFIALYKHKNDWLPVILLSGIWLLIFFWIKAFKLSFSSADSTISYRTLFGGVKCMSMSDIHSAKIIVGEYKTGFEPLAQLVLQSKANGEKIKINLKVFSAKDIADLLRTLDLHLKALGNPGLPQKGGNIFGKKGIATNADKKTTGKNEPQPVIYYIIGGALLVFVISLLRGLLR